MSKKKFTIITVCYNAEEHIKETIESLLCQTYNDYEYIVKDGLSEDDTLNIVYDLLNEKENTRVVSSADNGIYDAMNQAIEMAQGEYIYFLNAGDCFYDKDVLKNTAAFLDKNEVDVAYGNILSIMREKNELRVYGKMCEKKVFFLVGACICHQAIFVKKKLLEEKKFDLNYRVCADREWQLYFIKKKKKFASMQFEVAKVLAEGFSHDNIETLEQETLECLYRYCKNSAWIYKVILKMKKNRFVLATIKVLEMALLTKEK